DAPLRSTLRRSAVTWDGLVATKAGVEVLIVGACAGTICGAVLWPKWAWKLRAKSGTTTVLTGVGVSKAWLAFVGSWIRRTMARPAGPLPGPVVTAGLLVATVATRSGMRRSGFGLPRPVTRS